MISILIVIIMKKILLAYLAVVREEVPEDHLIDDTV